MVPLRDLVGFKIPGVPQVEMPYHQNGAAVHTPIFYLSV